MNRGVRILCAVTSVTSGLAAAGLGYISSEAFYNEKPIYGVVFLLSGAVSAVSSISANRARRTFARREANFNNLLKPENKKKEE